MARLHAWRHGRGADPLARDRASGARIAELELPVMARLGLSVIGFVDGDRTAPQALVSLGASL